MIASGVYHNAFHYGIVAGMSENLEDTHKLSPFETLVLQRFDEMNDRLGKLEARKFETKPIWEQALAEILEVKAEVLEVKSEVVMVGKRIDKCERAIRVLGDDVVQVRVDLRGFDERITAVEGSRP